MKRSRVWAAARVALLAGVVGGAVASAGAAQAAPVSEPVASTAVAALPQAYSASAFLTDLADGHVTQVTLDGNGNANVTLRGEVRTRNVVLPPSAETLRRLRDAGVTVRVVGGPAPLGWVVQVLPLVLTVLILVLVWRSVRGGNNANGANSFGRSRATVVREGQVKLTFADVAGCDEAKTDLTEVVDFLRHPERYHQLGARIPHGLLLVGPPGSGKTLLAKAVAGEAGVPYFSISGSDFVEMFVGVGAARVRDLFEQAKKQTPCIVFIDEIDAVGRKRGTGLNGGNDEREQTLNQLLVEMDGFGTTHDVIVLAATNRPDVLDAALLRPGRFDRQVVVDAPDVRGREMILKIHARKKPLDPTVDLALVARRTPGMVGADLENLLNEAALQAARNGRETILMADIDEAADRVLMGPERRSMVIPEEDRRVTAYHEVGHALAAQLLPHANRVHKLTVVPRGRAAGYMLPLPEDRVHYPREALEDMIAVALAGRAAEEVVFGEVTTGAQNDFQQATGVARRMITEWGMSARVGKVALAQEQEGYLGGGSVSSQVSQDTARVVDEEVSHLLEAQYARVLDLLRTHLARVHGAVEVLLRRETLSGAEFATLLDGGQVDEPPPLGGQIAPA
ncbi:ATP-dependent zinc metalloprotease FtsH [Deinococcus maricopensis]|uniref:ATP-dependent zinc metalloprotease FtsH n=1 Tax=Deinococcus maricopensis (strain DSM 21211 / LMG 22137 / NRRL B-23946 / LB-34) TaxID=709986 RepID=E8UBU5_DEIML|nr:ATP-dependent zinc metalloprotease FtsH [Deinococcus maricopensis]ADV68534.1 ATP-dependent metalloprotease FtsH [Deinococcus maricopensis DSM 21211]